MKTKIKSVYYCDYCKKYFLRKDACTRHEVICSENPDNFRACFDCDHLTKKETDYYYDTFQGQDSRKVFLFFCPKINAYLYPPKVQKNKKWFELGDEDNIPMRKECEYQKKMGC